MHVKTLFPCLFILLLSGCATPGKDMLPKGGDMTMAQIYYRETGQRAPAGAVSDTKADEAAVQQVSTPPGGQGSYGGEGGADLNTLNAQFKTLANPQIIVYISPHLVHTPTGSVPVPGYVTAYFMYPQTEFAMPDEHE